MPGNDFQRKKLQDLKDEVLTELVLNEFVEVAVPIAFVSSFSIAYYGPNRSTLGTIGAEIWHHKKIDNLNAFLMPVAEMTLIDSASIIFSGVALWLVCRINIFKEYCNTIKQYWIYLSLWGGALISAVSIINISI